MSPPRRTFGFALGLCSFALASGCSRALPEGRAAPEPPPPASSETGGARAPEVAATNEPAKEIDPRFVGIVRDAYAAHRAWGRVDDEMRWAPWLCRLPEPGRPAMSRASEGGHARKLYSLFARDRERYVSARGAADAGASQIVVKVSYVPELLPPGETAPLRAHETTAVDGGVPVVGHEPLDHFRPYLTEGDTTYRAGAIAGYYVMAEVPRDTDGADEGWVYGTLTRGGEVTSAGRVSSCMGCHVRAPNGGRLFGRGGG